MPKDIKARPSRASTTRGPNFEERRGAVATLPRDLESWCERDFRNNMGELLNE